MKSAPDIVADKIYWIWGTFRKHLMKNPRDCVLDLLARSRPSDSPKYTGIGYVQDFEDSWHLWRLGTHIAERGHIEKALSYFLCAIENYPYAPFFYINAGACYAKLGKWELALSCWKQVARRFLKWRKNTRVQRSSESAVFFFGV